MTEHFIDLTDGTRLAVKVNFGTIYYMQKQKGYYRLAKKAGDDSKSLSDTENFELAAYIIYALLRSNGRTVTFDEALSLMPPDAKSIEAVMDSFQSEYDGYSKKKAAKTMTIPSR